MRVPRFLSGRCGQIKKQAHGELSPWTSIHFSSGRSNRGYATPRPPQGSSSVPDLEYRYYPQKAEYHYYDDKHQCNSNQVAVTHSSTSLRPILRPKELSFALTDKPREQEQDQEDQDNDYKYGYEPSPHVLTSFFLSNERQHEHDQKDHRQNDDHNGESPVYPPSPHSPSLGGRWPQ